MNCSIGNGQNYFSLSCSIFYFFSLQITYSFVHAILTISVSFEHCVFCEHVFSITGKNYTAQKYAWVQKQYGHFAGVSYLQNTVSVVIHRICNVWTELKLTVLCHIALGICITILRLTEKYFPSWVCGSEVVLCWDDGFVSPMVHKTRPTGTFIQTNEHHHIGVQCEWNNERAVSIVLIIIDCECMYLQLVWHFTRRNTSHLYMSMKKR